MRVLEDKFPAIVRDQVTLSNVEFAQRLTSELPIDCGLNTFVAWGHKFTELGLSPDNDAVMTSKDGYAPQVICRSLTEVQNVDEAMFVANVIQALESMEYQTRQLLLAEWDQMLERLSLSWQQITFDIAVVLGLPRAEEVAA